MEAHNDIKVSVIIPCYNAVKYVEETLQSVSGQTFKNIEIIAVDDGSTDDTFSVINKYKDIDNRLTTIKIQNGGSSKARMEGAKLAKGEYLLFLDSDDLIDPTYIEKCIFIARQGYDIVYTKARFFGRKPGELYLPEFNLLDFLCSNCIYVSALIRKSLFDLVGGFDTSILQMEDWECFINMIKNGGKVYRIPEMLFLYRKREDCSSKSDSATNDEMENSFFAIYTKHYEFYRSNNLGLKDLLWRMHKHRLNRWRRLAYRIFKPKKYIEEYKGIKLN